MRIEEEENEEVVMPVLALLECVVVPMFERLLLPWGIVGRGWLVLRVGELCTVGVLAWCWMVVAMKPAVSGSPGHDGV